MSKDKSSEKQSNRATGKPLIVGLGASAGGLEPLKIFFSKLPEKTGMAFIVIVHLSPEHESSMAELLQDHTPLKVLQVNEKVEIKPDHVYVIPPNKMLSVGDNHLELSELEKGDHQPEVIDRFFRSLGEVKADRSVCIILSGTGSDGTLGLKAVKENGGLVMAQDPNEARYGGMPHSAINTELVDKVLPVAQMPDELIKYHKNLDGIDVSDQPDKLSGDERDALSKILKKVRSETDHDFSNYKRSTILRRIKRRMHVNHTETLPGYLDFLNDHPREAHELFRDFLISVTNFFRDPKAFKALENKAIPKLFEDKNADDELRVWVPGCATGEEAYSIAMLLREYAGSIDNPPKIQIFATDVDENALNQARKGIYSQSIATDLTEQRLQRFFTKSGNKYRVKGELRDMILFAEHNLLGSPPFSNQDLISCRNLLIYLDKELQSEVFNLFHYALRPDGYLFLGNSDSNLEATELFTSFDKKHRLYRQTSRTQSKIHLPDFPLSFDQNKLSASHSWKMRSETKTNFGRLHRMLVTRHYAPASVIINDNKEVLHATGDINRYLKYTTGEPSRDILEMAIPELRRTLRRILYGVKKEEDGQPVRKRMRLRLNGEPHEVELNVQKIDEKDFPNDLRLVVFREIEKSDGQITASDGSSRKGKKKPGSDEEADIIDELENELNHTKEQLQITTEDYETSNEELRASNEELQSMNEELQSTTEELETSQEELQSVNEELKTTNRELETKVDDLFRSNSDLKNLMDASEIAILFLDTESHVQRFTTKATEIFNLTANDEGRPLGHFTNRLHYDKILDDVKQVFDQSDKIKKEVSAEDGRYYIMRLTPYQTTEEKIEGVVITFVEVTELKAAQEKLAGKIERVKDLQRQILKNDVNERWKLGQYLHDELGQSLTAAGLMLNTIKKNLREEGKGYEEEMDRLVNIIKECADGVRDLSHEIVPVDVQQEGVLQAFSELSKHIEKTYGINVTVEGNRIMDGVGNIEIATNLYRIAREAAKNAAKHGNADNLLLKLEADDDYLYLDIEDDGKGLATEEATEDGKGLNIMRHRMELLGGRFEIKESTHFENTGVQISCRLPKDWEE